MGALGAARPGPQRPGKGAQKVLRPLGGACRGSEGRTGNPSSRPLCGPSPAASPPGALPGSPGPQAEGSPVQRPRCGLSASRFRAPAGRPRRAPALGPSPAPPPTSCAARWEAARPARQGAARCGPGAGQVGARAGGVWAGRSGSEPRAGRAGGRSPSTWPCRPRHLARPHLAGGCPRDPRPAGCSPAGRSPPAAAPWGRAPRPPLPRPLPVAGVACGCGAPGLPHCNPQSAAALLQARLRCVCCLQLQEALPVAGQPCG